MKTLKKNTKHQGNVLHRHSGTMSELATELLHAVTKTHMAHLKTTSHSVHMALNDFYEEMPELVDSVIEQYQGVTEKLLDYPSLTVKPINTTEEAVLYLRDIHSKITSFQKTCEFSEIINALDNIKSSIDVTKYKLIFLK